MFNTKVSILGASGGVGQANAITLKNSLPAGSELVLYDINPATPGLACDLSHIPTDVKVSGYSDEVIPAAVFEGTHIVLVIAGVARKPGMTRDDLFNINASIVQKLVARGAEVNPDALFCIVTNPVNSTVPVAAETLKKAGVYNPKKLVGVTSLDCLRAETFLSQKKHLNPKMTNVPIIGGHSAQTILPLLSQLPEVKLTQSEIEELTDRVRNGGTEVVEAKQGAGSATLSTGVAISRFTMSMVHALSGKQTVECAYSGMDGQVAPYFSGPLVFGPSGIEKVLPYGPLSDYEQKIMDELLPILNKNIEKGASFISG